MMGFSVARREELPDKIYKDCLHCPSLYACDEIAMVRGPLPANMEAYRETRIPIPLVRLQV
jgi:amino-acid N-acetyltransferase